jgi:hypothetical protein
MVSVPNRPSTMGLTAAVDSIVQTVFFQMAFILVNYVLLEVY